MISVAKQLINGLPDTVNILDFNLTDIEDYMTTDIIEATCNESVKLLCFCSGNGIDNDWLVSNKLVYKIPCMKFDEEIHIIDMNRIGLFDISIEVFKELLSHNELAICIDLGDEVRILFDLQNNTLELIDNGYKQNITISDKPVENYFDKNNYVRGWAIKENPYIFKYHNYSVQIGPCNISEPNNDIPVKFWKDGQQIIIKDIEEEDKEEDKEEE